MGQIAAAELHEAADREDRDRFEKGAEQRGAEAPPVLFHDERGHVVQIGRRGLPGAVPVQLHQAGKSHDMSALIRPGPLFRRGKIEPGEMMKGSDRALESRGLGSERLEDRPGFETVPSRIEHLFGRSGRDLGVGLDAGLQHPRVVHEGEKDQSAILLASQRRPHARRDQRRVHRRDGSRAPAPGDRPEAFLKRPGRRWHRRGSRGACRPRRDRRGCLSEAERAAPLR